MGHRAVVPEQFTTFGPLLRYLRERAELTQRELALQVGYHYSYLSRVERGERTPDSATVLARFIPALYLDDDPAWAARLVDLAAGARETAPKAPGTDEEKPRPISRLPAPLNPLLGREAEVAAIGRLLSDPGVRLVTLTGPPGIGKTRLALECGRDAAGAFEDGAAFVDLTTVRDPLLFAAHLVQSLGIPEKDGNASETVLHAALGDGSRLLVLDNFEQIVAAAPAVSRLLEAAAGLKVLATSREALRLNGEYEFPVPALPADSDAGAPAVALFIQRAQAVQPGFRLTPENAPEIAQLCMRLDGLPLAIELAAARVALFTPGAMLARMDARLGWLRGGKRDEPAWRRTLEGAIDWSYRLLADQEKDLFAALAVFPDGGPLTAVERICAGDLDTLAALGEKSLIVIRPAGESGPEIRFTWLESLREFAAAILADLPERRLGLLAAHARYYRALVEETEAEFARSRSSEWLAALDGETENLRAAIAWALEAGDGETAVAMCAGLADYWDIRGRFEEGRRWLPAALELGGLEPSATLGRAFGSAGWLARRQNDFRDAIRFYRKSVKTWEALKDQAARASALMDLGALMTHEDAPGHEMEATFRQALAIYREQDDARGIPNALNQLGIIAYGEGDFRRALDYFEEVVSLRGVSGDRIATSGAMNNLGLAAYALGDYEAACGWHVQALVLREELGFEGRISQSQTNLAFSLLRLGEVEAAEDHARASLQAALKMQLKMGAVEAVEALGTAAAARGQAVRAARLLGASEALREQIGAGRDKIQQSDLAWARRLAGEAAGSDAWRSAWEAGRRLSLEQAAAEANERMGE